MVINDIKEALLKRVKDIGEDNLYSLVLYGSFARGDNTEHSDIDVLIIADNMNEVKLYDLTEKVNEDLRGKFSFSTVSFLHYTPEVARKFHPIYLTIVFDSIIIYDRDNFFSENVIKDTKNLLKTYGGKIVKFHYVVFDKMSIRDSVKIFNEAINREIKVVRDNLTYTHPDYACALLACNSIKFILHNLLRLVGIEAPLKRILSVARLEERKLTKLTSLDNIYWILNKINNAMIQEDFSSCSEVILRLRLEVENLMKIMDIYS